MCYALFNICKSYMDNLYPSFTVATLSWNRTEKYWTYSVHDFPIVYNKRDLIPCSYFCIDPWQDSSADAHIYFVIFPRICFPRKKPANFVTAYL